MIIDNNLIAYEYFKDNFTPKEVYTSGKKDETSLNDIYNKNVKDNAVLILEDDIINDDGYGLKKGFYNVKPDKYMEFLLIYQSGKIKAKIPVVNLEFFESIEPKQDKPKRMSHKRYLKELEKEKRKYYNGENPEEIDYKEVKIHYINDQKIYVLIYTTEHVELTGIVKF